MGARQKCRVSGPTPASESEPGFCEHWPGHRRSYALGARRRQRPPVPRRQLPSSSLSALSSPLLSPAALHCKSWGPALHRFPGHHPASGWWEALLRARREGRGWSSQQVSSLSSRSLSRHGAARRDRLSPALAPLCPSSPGVLAGSWQCLAPRLYWLASQLLHHQSNQYHVWKFYFKNSRKFLFFLVGSSDPPRLMLQGSWSQMVWTRAAALKLTCAATLNKPLFSCPRGGLGSARASPLLFQQPLWPWCRPS